LENKLLKSATFDISLYIEVAKFINDMGKNPYYWYFLKGEEFKFLKILTEVFLDNADSDRDSYVLLILLNCPEELKKEVVDSIYKASSIPFIYARYLTK
jgi:hypothetical protein